MRLFPHPFISLPRENWSHGHHGHGLGIHFGEEMTLREGFY